MPNDCHRSYEEGESDRSAESVQTCSRLNRRMCSGTSVRQRLNTKSSKSRCTDAQGKPDELTAWLAARKALAKLRNGFMRIVCLSLAIMLTGCASPEQRAEETAQYINASYGPVCEKLGYSPGSDAHRNCMVSMFNADQVQRAPGFSGFGGFRRR
jgi:hypothetical protein